MFPYNDASPNRYSPFPMMLSILLTLNLLGMGISYYFVDQGEAIYKLFVYQYGFVPSFIFARQGGGALSAITYLFLHADFTHLGGNMLYMWVFGRRVEDACGPGRFLFFYLTCGVIAALVSTIIHGSNSNIPIIGASGAVFGLMGAYLMLFPEGKIRTFVFFFRVEIRAIWLILYYFATQIPAAIQVLLAPGDKPAVAFWAHLGGFFGSLLIFFFLRPEAWQRYQEDLPI